LENAALPKTVTDTRLHLAALGRMWDAAGLSFVEKLNRKQARCPHRKTDPGGNCYECGKRGAAAGANVSQDVLKVHPHDYGVRSSDIKTAQGDRPSVDSQRGGCEQEAA
jgi:hypothetical protein